MVVRGGRSEPPHCHLAEVMGIVDVMAYGHDGHRRMGNMLGIKDKLVWFPSKGLLNRFTQLSVKLDGPW